MHIPLDRHLTAPIARLTALLLAGLMAFPVAAQAPAQAPEPAQRQAPAQTPQPVPGQEPAPGQPQEPAPGQEPAPRAPAQPREPAQTPVPAQTQAESQSSSQTLPTLADVVGEVVPAVVSIAVRSEAPAVTNPLYSDPFFRRFFGDQQQQQPRVRMSAGSGVIVDAENGYVLTNSHVVAGGQEIAVTLTDGRVLTAELVGSDQATDVAVLQVEAENLTQIEIGESSELRVGDYVVAIGNPFGLGQTVTSGIVSALGRSGLDIEGYEDFIQTDAAINMGNSGGALITLDGRLVGINTAILSPAGGSIGIGFAVPTDMATSVMAQLIEHGEVRRGQLGISIQDVTPDLVEVMGLEEATGALVSSVEPGSAAEEAGIQAGDVVLAVDGRPVTSSTDLRNRIGLTPSGTTVQLQILRDGEESEVSATISEGQSQSTADSSALPAQLQGATLRDLEPGEAGQGLTGAVIDEVAPGSPAEAAGLLAGDIIVAVNRQVVPGAEELTAVLSQMTGTMALQIIRDGMPMLLVIR